MNKVIAILVAFFSVFCAYAQKADKSEQYRVRITKMDGTTLEGYSMTSFYNTMLPEVKKFTFSTEYKGETTTYTSEEWSSSTLKWILCLLSTNRFKHCPLFLVLSAKTRNHSRSLFSCAFSIMART